MYSFDDVYRYSAHWLLWNSEVIMQIFICLFYVRLKYWRYSENTLQSVNQSFILWWTCWYANVNPYVSVESLILRKSLRPVGLLFKNKVYLQNPRVGNLRFYDWLIDWLLLSILFKNISLILPDIIIHRSILLVDVAKLTNWTHERLQFWLPSLGHHL